MFTGIIETIGRVNNIEKFNGNKIFTIESNFASELKVDQSVAHNGVCLTVTRIAENEYDVVAVSETLKKSNLGFLNIGDKVNLERSLRLGDRLDGHIVQGHVDQTAVCTKIINQKGSYNLSFKYRNSDISYITVEKGSITINGVSLTVFDSKPNDFTVTIIPYTLEQTTFKEIRVGDEVNLEFDIIGKYVHGLYSKNT